MRLASLRWARSLKMGAPRSARLVLSPSSHRLHQWRSSRHPRASLSRRTLLQAQLSRPCLPWLLPACPTGSVLLHRPRRHPLLQTAKPLVAGSSHAHKGLVLPLLRGKNLRGRKRQRDGACERRTPLRLHGSPHSRHPHGNLPTRRALTLSSRFDSPSEEAFLRGPRRPNHRWLRDGHPLKSFRRPRRRSPSPLVRS